MTDHFTRYAQAFPTRNQLAKTTAKIIFENFVVHYGFPARIYSDQGRNFESSLIKELCSLACVHKSWTTPYHPMGNGMVERFNQTLLKMLGTLEDHQKQDWKSYVAPLVHAYNATLHDSTGFSPFFFNVWETSQAGYRCLSWSEFFTGFRMNIQRALCQ